MQQVAKKSPSGGGGGGGGGLNNIISYKRDRLQLPEYDYNMTPQDIIRFSNQNFDYERYIRDWVLPYSNSNFYIRRFTDGGSSINGGGDATAVASAAQLLGLGGEPYSPSGRPYSVSNIESSYYLEPREEDYANYYKSVGNITKVDVKSDEHRPLAKKPSSSTLEYLDLSDRNPQACIDGTVGAAGGVNGSTYGRLKKEPAQRQQTLLLASSEPTPAYCQTSVHTIQVPPATFVKQPDAVLRSTSKTTVIEPKPGNAYCQKITLVDVDPRHRQRDIIEESVVAAMAAPKSPAAAAPKPAAVHGYTSLNCPQPVVIDQNTVPRYAPSTTIVSSHLPPNYLLQQPAKQPPCVITSITGPVQNDEKAQLLAYLDALDRAKEPTTLYQQPHQRPQQQQQQQQQQQPQAPSSGGGARKPIVITRPGGTKVISQPGPAPPSSSLQTLLQPAAPTAIDPFRSSKVTIIDSTTAAPSPPVYPQYKPPVLPPTVTAYVNPNTGVVTTYETMILDDRPDSTILDPPPMSGVTTFVDPNNQEPGQEYRINKDGNIEKVQRTIENINFRPIGYADESFVDEQGAPGGGGGGAPSNDTSSYFEDFNRAPPDAKTSPPKERHVDVKLVPESGARPGVYIVGDEPASESTAAARAREIKRTPSRDNNNGQPRKPVYIVDDETTPSKSNDDKTDESVKEPKSPKSPKDKPQKEQLKSSEPKKSSGDNSINQLLKHMKHGKQLPSSEPKKEKEIPHVIKVRKLDTLFSQEQQPPQPIEKNESGGKLPRKSENSISRLIKAFEEKKDRNRLESTDDKSTTDISLTRPLSSASTHVSSSAAPVSKRLAPQAPSSTSSRPTEQIEIINRPIVNSSNTNNNNNEDGSKKEETAANLEKEFQTRISKLIKKFEASPEGGENSTAATAQDATASIKSEPVKLSANMRKTKSTEAEDTGDEVELSTSIRGTRGDLKSTSSKSSDVLNRQSSVDANGDADKDVSERVKSARSESDITAQKRLVSTASTATSRGGDDPNSFTILAKSRLTEKKNKQESSKKNISRPV